MTAPPQSAASLHRPATLDRQGVLELAGVFLLAGAVLAFSTTHLVQDVRDERVISGTSIALGTAIGAFLGLAAAVGLFFAWRHTGGRPAQRLGRAAWRTGVIPATREQRLVVLRDLQRRDRRFEQGFPASVLAVLWAVIAALQIAANHTLSQIIISATPFALYLYNAVAQRWDRRHRAELERIIASLRTSTADAHHG